MLLSKEVEITLNPANAKHYRNLGYDIPEKEWVGKKLIVKYEDVNKGSKAIVNVKCDYCNAIINVTYNNYIRIIKKYEDGKYACKKCKYIKVAQSNLEKYGYINPGQVPEIKEKIAQSKYEFNNQSCSRQQLHLHSLYGGELNYPINKYNADIMLEINENLKIDIEYSGGGHDLKVKFGLMTQEKFDNNELIRDKLVKSNGYKVMKITSKDDKLPHDEILNQMLKETIDFFTENPERTWVEYDIDNSIMRNGNNKNGIKYDYGELRYIKKEENVA